MLEEFLAKVYEAAFIQNRLLAKYRGDGYALLWTNVVELHAVYN